MVSFRLLGRPPEREFRESHRPKEERSKGAASLQPEAAPLPETATPRQGVAAAVVVPVWLACAAADVRRNGCSKLT